MPTVQEGSSMNTDRKLSAWIARHEVRSIGLHISPGAIQVWKEGFADGLEEREGQLEWLTDLLEVLQEAKTDADKLDDAEAAVKAAIKLYEREG